MSDMAVPEEANAMFLTLFQKKNKLLQIVNSIESKEIDSYIWVKNKQFKPFVNLKLSF